MSCNATPGEERNQKRAPAVPAVGRQFWRDANYRRQALVTPDGGLIALDWYHGSDTLPHLAESTPVLMVFHGLTGVHAASSFTHRIA